MCQRQLPHEPNAVVYFFSYLLIRAIIASPCRASAATDVARLASGSPPEVQFLNCLLTRAGTSSFWTL